MAAVFGHVFHIGEDLLVLADAIPQQLENRAGHVRVPDQTVGLTQKFGLGVTGIVGKSAVAVGDAALQICFRDDEVLVLQHPLDARRGNFAVVHGSPCSV